MGPHEEYRQAVEKRIGKIAWQMLSNDIPYLEGCARLHLLLNEAGLPEDDHDVVAFRTAVSETAHIPFGGARRYRSAAVASSLAPEISRATEWAQQVTLAQCKSLAIRFGADQRG